MGVLHSTIEIDLEEVAGAITLEMLLVAGGAVALVFLVLYVSRREFGGAWD